MDGRPRRLGRECRQLDREDNCAMSMTTPQNAPRRQYGLLAVAFILLLLGGVLIYLGSHNFAIRAIGVGVVMAGAYLINVRSRSVAPLPNYEAKDRRVTRGLWIASLSLVPILAGAWYLVQLDFANGGKEIWPLNLAFGVVLVCAVVWSLLVAKTLGRGRRGQ